MKITTIKQTVLACPEAYEILDENNNCLSRIRLRNGNFRVHTDTEDLFHRSFPVSETDELEREEKILQPHDSDGVFDSDEARETYLRIAVRKTAEKYDIAAPRLNDIYVERLYF